MTESIPEDDADRLAENIDMNFGAEIFSEEDFNNAFDNYMANAKTTEKGKLRRKAWKSYKTSKSISPDRKRQLKYTPKQKVKAKISALKTQQVRSRRVVRIKGAKKKTIRFSIPARIKGKKVFARKIKTKTGVRYVDKKGRFASVKKKGNHD